MNDKIKFLAEKAGGHNNISKFRGHRLPPAPNYIDPATVDLEKFTELIVQECINSIKVWRDASDDDMKNNNIAYWQGYQGGCDDGIVEIMQRFGVEE